MEDIALNLKLEDTFKLAEGLLPEEFEFALHDEINMFVQPRHVEYYDQEIYYISPLFGELVDGEVSECHFTLTDKAGKTKKEAIENLTALGFKYNSSLLDSDEDDEDEKLLPNGQTDGFIEFLKDLKKR